MEFDIVLVLYNSGGWLRGCVEALAAARYDPAKLRLVLVDNASGEDPAPLVNALRAEFSGFGGMELVKNGANFGFGRACNIGAARGTAPFLFFLNVDTEVAPDVFTELERAVNAVDEAGVKAGCFECRQLPFETGHYLDPVTMESTWASGAAMLVRRGAFEAAGGFDERLFLYCEDVDLSWRLRAAGWKLLYVPRAEVYHYSYLPKGVRGEPVLKLGEYAGGLFGNLLLRFKFGTLRDMWNGERMYLHALRHPRHFPGVRRLLAKNWLRHLYKLWPFLFWRFGHLALYRAKPAHFDGPYTADRGQSYFEKPAEEPLVSVVVRTCGRPDTLRQTLSCLRHQTYRNFEVVVTEDGPPASRDMIETEFPDLPLRYFSTGENIGRAKNGNLGLAQAKGEYLNFLDDDDFFYPDHLELLVARLGEDPDADLVTASSLAMEADVTSRAPYAVEMRELYPMVFDRMDNFLLCQWCLMPIQSVMFKRALFEQYGGLQEDVDGDEDWAMWLKYFAAGRRINEAGVDIRRATSLFLVPAGKSAAWERILYYRKYENAMLDGADVAFSVTPRQMRAYFLGFVGDLRHLERMGKLHEFLEEQAGRADGQKRE